MTPGTPPASAKYWEKLADPTPIANLLLAPWSPTVSCSLAQFLPNVIFAYRIDRAEPPSDAPPALLRAFDQACSGDSPLMFTHARTDAERRAWAWFMRSVEVLPRLPLAFLPPIVSPSELAERESLYRALRLFESGKERGLSRVLSKIQITGDIKAALVDFFCRFGVSEHDQEVFFTEHATNPDAACVPLEESWLLRRAGGAPRTPFWKDRGLSPGAIKKLAINQNWQMNLVRKRVAKHAR
jgi:hypothetical protein